MSIFDSIIGMAEQKFSLGKGKADGLLSGLLTLIISDGGLSDFLARFREAGLSEMVDSWITTGSNTPISNQQLESALDADALSSLATEAGVERSAATSAMAAMVPQVIDRLTPDGVIPDDNEGMLSKIRGYIGGLGGAALGAVGAAGAVASGAFDRVGNATENVVDRGSDAVRGGISSVGNAAGTVGDRVGDRVTAMRTDDNLDTSGDSSVLKWLLPLLLLGLLVALGFWFCGRSAPTTTTVTNLNANANANRTNSNVAVVVNNDTAAKAVDSSFSIKADNGKYTVTGVVPDEAAKKQIVDALTAQYGAGNVNFDGLTINASAKPFAAGWWDNFARVLPNLKDWKTGTLAFVGNGITQAVGLPVAAIAQIKSLFTGWSLPLSIVGAEGATTQANEESLKALAGAGSIDEVVKALNISIINFASASSTIPADAKPILAKAAEVLKKQTAGTSVEIGGYTDNQGNAEANKKLSQSRADAVKKALVGLGVQDAMLKAVGYGDASPVGDNTTEDGRFKNRRIEYKTSDGSAPTATTTTTTVNSNTAR